MRKYTLNAAGTNVKTNPICMTWSVVGSLLFFYVAAWMSPFETWGLCEYSYASEAAAMDHISVGIIGMGDMGKMYAERISNAGWR